MNNTSQKPHRFFAFDTEADGPCAGLYSMVSIGIVEIANPSNIFYAQIKPISESWIPGALAVSGFTREQCLEFEEALTVMKKLESWLNKLPGERCVLVSDNPAFDWQWINYYCHRFLGGNPFGHSARRIGDVYSGYVGNLKEASGWKKWRKTKHTHNALEDAKGVAEGWLELSKQITLKKKF